MLLSLFFGLVWVRETKGNSLQEIEGMLLKEFLRTQDRKKVDASTEQRVVEKNITHMENNLNVLKGIRHL